VWLTLVLLLSTLVVAAVLATALLPPQLALRVGALTNAVQLHTISILGIYPSLALLSWLSTWRTIFGSPLWRWPWMQALLALAAAQAISIIWSPTPLLGVRYLIYLAPLPFVAHAFYRLSLEKPEIARDCLRWLLLGSAVEAVVVIVFRLLPSVELQFLNSPLAGLFISPNTLEALFTGARNNVLDPAKSGGLFVNANMASTYLGMSSVAAWYVSRIMRSPTLRFVSLLDWTAVLFTGSKAGLLCAAAIPIGMAFITVVRARRANPITLFAATIGIAAVTIVLMLPLAQELLDEYRSNTLATLGTRGELWSYAVQFLGQHPIRGLGFGGWEKLFELQAALTGSRTIMPAHNSFFILWLQSGLPGVIGGVLLVGTIYAAATKVLSSRDYATRQLAMAAISAFSWYFVQGLGENFGLVGEAHMTPLLAALLGVLCARHDGALERYEHIESVRGGAAPSAIPAV
jgi:O-antigen ligase